MNSTYRTSEERRGKLAQFHERRNEFQNRLRFDHRLNHSTVRVALEITSLINAKKGYAWPTYDQLAAACFCSRNTVRRAVWKLHETSWFMVDYSLGQGQANRCTPVYDNTIPPRIVDNVTDFKVAKTPPYKAA